MSCLVPIFKMMNYIEENAIDEEMQQMVLNEISPIQFELLPNLPTISMSIISKRDLALPQVSFSELTTATNNWNKNMLIGRGHYGCVYKGTWRNSSVGIKNYPLKEVKQLLTEIFCLELYRHTNIIPLVAYSFDSRQEAHLVYEYVPGGSLSKRFKTKITQKALSWQQRMKISVGIARGIHYLHTARAKPVVHGDIKAANILLRSDEEPVIGDFGTAHECSRESATENVVGKCKGTLCYLPPEYLQNKLTSTKLDVYGFGVVLLRLATGMPAYLEEYKPPKFLRDVVINYKGDISILTDFRAIGDGKKYFGGLIKVGKACVAKLPKARPDMAVVLSQLEKIYPE